MKLQDAEQNLIFKCIGGSHAYGTNTSESDTDYRGIFTIPSDQYFRLNKPPEQVSDEKNDTVYYTVLRFLELACAGNPNILELLWTPDDCVLKTSESWERIKAIRNTFITKSVLDAFGGYAVAQIKKARGQNKLINNPMPERKPTKEDFCWILPMKCWRDMPDNDYYCGSQLELHQDYPCRPEKLSEFGLHQELYDCVSLEHFSNVYRLYCRGKRAKGIFRGDDTADIVSEFIPIGDEYEKFAGLLFYNKDAYERELRQWKQYWSWKEKRNESRWRDQEGQENPVDFKNMGHCLRLLYSAENIFENGEPIVRFSGEKLQRLKDIRAGKIPYEEILSEAEERLAKIDATRELCALPSKADMDLVSELSVKLHGR